MRSLRLIVLFLIVCATACLAGDGPPVGKWACIARPASDREVPVTVILKQEADRLSGVMILNSGDELRLVDPKFEAGQLSFGFRIDGAPYTTTVQPVEDRLVGKYSSPDDSGTVECTRK